MEKDLPSHQKMNIFYGNTNNLFTALFDLTLQFSGEVVVKLPTFKTHDLKYFERIKALR